MQKPKIRFKGYQEEWEQRKLGDVYNFQYGEFNNNPDNGGEYPIYGANGIIGGYTNYNAEDSAIIGHMGAYAGYVVWASGKHFVTYNGTIAKPSDDSLDSKFGYYMLSQKQIYRICAGSGQPFVSYADLNGIDIEIPIDKSEQEKIGFYFSILDHLITLHHRKCEEMKILKKYMLQKMFPQNGNSVPEIRFLGFTEDWEQRKFGDLGSVAMCKRVFKEQTTSVGEIPFYKIGTFGAEPDAFISRKLFEEYKSKFQYPNVGDMLISASGTIGRTVEYSGEEAYFQDSNIVWFKHDDRIDNSFLRCIYNIVKWNGIEGSTIKRLYNDNFLKTELYMPTSGEQAKIGAYFRSLDHLITLHQKKCDELRNIKKFMLQNMFI